jgi:hypothetical protein
VTLSYAYEGFAGLYRSGLNPSVRVWELAVNIQVHGNPPRGTACSLPLNGFQTGTWPQRGLCDQGALNKTLDSVFSNPDSTTGWILYNDEKPGDVPGKDNGAPGHTKGVGL